MEIVRKIQLSGVWIIIYTSESNRRCQSYRDSIVFDQNEEPTNEQIENEINKRKR